MRRHASSFRRRPARPPQAGAPAPDDRARRRGRRRGAALRRGRDRRRDDRAHRRRARGVAGDAVPDGPVEGPPPRPALRADDPGARPGCPPGHGDAGTTPRDRLVGLIRVQIEAAVAMRDYFFVYFDGSQLPRPVYDDWRRWADDYERVWIK